VPRADDSGGEHRTIIPAMLDSAAIRASFRTWWSSDWMLQCEQPGWVRLAWTILFSCLVAGLLTLVSWAFARRIDLWDSLLWNFVIANCVGLAIHGIFSVARIVLGAERIRNFGALQRVLFYAGTPIVGVLIGFAVGYSIMGVDVPRMVVERPNVPLGIVLLSVVMSAVLYRYFANKARLAELEAGQARERVRITELERQAVAAKLSALQAQIEPHFLFNTLANVVSLIEAEPAQARRMLERLIELLRSSLAASRAERTTLDQEVRLVTAYLDILKVRMGERLQYRIDVPAELGRSTLPPLTLQPLVENAIRHGLEPKLGGGTLRLRAWRSHGDLRIDVEDDGLGFAPRAGAGVGLSNVRDRLASYYGVDARLAVEELQPGTRVSITMPGDA
jgi:two-component sensor histidine kinase